LVVVRTEGKRIDQSILFGVARFSGTIQLVIKFSNTPQEMLQRTAESAIDIEEFYYRLRGSSLFL
jgi:hypothetical protein